MNENVDLERHEQVPSIVRVTSLSGAKSAKATDHIRDVAKCKGVVPDPGVNLIGRD